MKTFLAYYETSDYKLVECLIHATSEREALKKLALRGKFKDIREIGEVIA